MRLIAVLLLVVASVANADSYLFGRSPDEAFGNAFVHHSARYRTEALQIMRAGFRPLTTNFGAAQPTPLRILIKSDEIASPITQRYVETLSKEKPLLMRIYGLTDADYNRLAAIAFGILGRETKFGTSTKYTFKETLQDEITGLKILKSWWTGGKVGTNSRGLTQIKAMPQSILRAYRFTLSGTQADARQLTTEDLDNPRVAAVATLGFLAESLKILKNRVRNKQLAYITPDNLFDYVLYVYFGSMRQLVNPHMDYRTGRLDVEAATPSRNLYVQTVRQYIRTLAFYEAASQN